MWRERRRCTRRCCCCVCVCFRACLKCRPNALIGFWASLSLSLSLCLCICLPSLFVSTTQIHYLLSNGRISNGKLPAIGQIAGPLNRTMHNHISYPRNNHHIYMLYIRVLIKTRWDSILKYSCVCVGE